MGSARTILVGMLAVGGAALACNAITGAGDLEPVDCVDCGDGGPARQLPSVSCTCAPSAPDGWRGPISLLEGSAAAAPSCAGLAVAFEGGVGPSAPSECTPCTCGAPSASCGITATMFGEPTCINGASCGATTIAPGACARATYCSFAGGATLSATASDAGGCAPDGGAPVAVTWQKPAIGCAAPEGDRSCTGGQVCSPALPGSRACIMHAGEVPCPSGPYQTRVVYHASVKDDRACTACSCSAPSGVQCVGGAVTFYSDTGCGDGGKVVSAAGCNPISIFAPLGSVEITTPPTATGGSCAPSGGEPLDGGVAPAEPTTACCLDP